MKNLIVIAGLTALTANAAELASAQETTPTTGQFYAGANYMLLDTEIDGEIGELVIGDSVQFHTLGGRAGYKFSNQFAIEVEASTGMSGKNVDDSVTLLGQPADFKGEVDISYLIGVFGVFEQPLTDDKKLNLFVRAGFLAGELKATGDIDTTVLGVPVTIAGDYATQESGPVFGGGLSYDLTDAMFARADATYIGLESFPTIAYAATIGFRF